jgi:hypothetical protein
MTQGCQLFFVCAHLTPVVPSAGGAKDREQNEEIYGLKIEVEVEVKIEIEVCNSKTKSAFPIPHISHIPHIPPVVP